MTSGKIYIGYTSLPYFRLCYSLHQATSNPNFNLHPAFLPHIDHPLSVHSTPEPKPTIKVEQSSSTIVLHKMCFYDRWTYECGHEQRIMDRCMDFRIGRKCTLVYQKKRRSGPCPDCARYPFWIGNGGLR